MDQLNGYIDSAIDYVVERIRSGLPKVKVRRPEGTFILWMDFTDLVLTSEEVDKRIAAKAHVGFTDGAGMESLAGTIFQKCIEGSDRPYGGRFERLKRINVRALSVIACGHSGRLLHTCNFEKHSTGHQRRWLCSVLSFSMKYGIRTLKADSNIKTVQTMIFPNPQMLVL